MPPYRSQSSQNAIEQEDRILLAYQEIDNEEKTPIVIVARTYSVHDSPFRARLRGTTSRAESRAHSHHLTLIEEESLLQCIMSMNIRGGAPRPSAVRKMASLLLTKRGSTDIKNVGLYWITNFIKRYPEQL